LQKYKEIKQKELEDKQKEREELVLSQKSTTEIDSEISELQKIIDGEKEPESNEALVDELNINALIEKINEIDSD
jgi:hypothetical protein